MDVRNFKLGWRFLIKEPAYSAVVVLGLALGFAACFLLLGFVRYSLGYDQAVPQAERIFMLKGKPNIGEPMWMESAPLPFLAAAQNSGMVESSTAFQPIFRAFKVGNQITKNVELYAVHPAFGPMFGVRAVEGDLQAALTRPDTLALTVRQAVVLFGDAHAVGKQLAIDGTTFTVAAIVPDPPSNSTIGYAALTGVGSAAWDKAEREELLQAWGRMAGGRLYVKLLPGASSTVLNALLMDTSLRSPLMSELPPELLTELAGKPLLDVRLTALTELYFDSDTANTPGSVQHGDRNAVYGLAAIAVLILLLAVANYVNLATVRTLRRQREIAIRKLQGASVGRLSRQFLAESLMVTLAATLLGLVLAQLLLPLFADLMGRKLDNLLTAANLGAALAIGVAVGLLAGAYPAWVAARVRPQQGLSGRGGSESGAALRLRRVLTVVQFASAMALTGVTLAISWQTWYASNTDPGFDPAPLLVLELPGEANSAPMRGLRQALLGTPGVTGVTGALDMVAGRSFGGNSEFMSRNDGKQVRLPLAGVSANFFDVFALRPVAGRLFDPRTDAEEQPAVVVLNAGAARELGFASAQAAAGQMITVGTGAEARTLRVAGVAPDIRFETLRQAPRPMVYVPSAPTNVLTVRSTLDSAQLEAAVDSLQRQYFPTDVVSVRRMQSYYADNYADDLRLAKLLAMAALLAIAIAAFGIYVLAAYNVQRLTKQIVMRKLFGAGPAAIGRLVGREFVLVIAISALLGLPLAQWANQRYLAGFVEHAPIGIWPLLAAVLVALLVTFLSTTRHALLAMRMAPAQALRSE